MSTQEKLIVEPIKLKSYEEKNSNGISYDTHDQFTGADECSEERWTGLQETRLGCHSQPQARQTYRKSYQSG